MSIQYKVCILSAGKGMRLGSLTKSLNKSLLPIGQKAIISHIIEKFPTDIEIVVATGYQGEKVREYLRHAHHDRKITIVNVENFDGQASGPGLSLLACKDQLQCPFIVYAADTMLSEKSLPPPSRNWMGVCSVYEDVENFCTVSVENGLISNLADKKKCNNTLAFIGVSGIKDFSIFWNALESNKTLINNEHQLSNGLMSLIDIGYYPEKFSWFDTGTVESYISTREAYESKEAEDIFNFDKINEFTYFVNKRVIKYFCDTNHVKMRKERSKKLFGMCPALDLSTRWFFSYTMVKGVTLYEVISPKVTSDFLTWLEENLWKELKYVPDEKFLKACQSFYRDKTYMRLKLFYRKYQVCDYNVLINGMKLPSIETLLDGIPWNELYNGIQSNFHGDLQFDNVLKTGWGSEEIDSFKLLDWRQDFGGLVDCGDVYYDLGKLYGGLTLPYNLIKKNKFSYYEDKNTGIRYDFQTSHNIGESRSIFEKFIERSHYSLQKVKIIRGLIFLNMSPLHEAPFDKMLYHMSRYYLSEAINEYK